MSIERLVGGLIRSAVRTPGRRSNGVQRLVRGNATAIGMGIVGLALGALDHYQSANAQTGGHGGDSDPEVQPAPPPLPRGGALPPRPPGAVSAGGPPPPPSSRPQPGPAQEEDATLLLRAMVSAAAADGTIDESERAKIFERAAEGGLDADERDLLEDELAAPLSLDELLAEVARAPRTQELRDQIYFVSLVSIRADSEAEKAHLRELATGLRVSPDKAEGWHQLLGLAL